MLDTFGLFSGDGAGNVLSPTHRDLDPVLWRTSDGATILHLVAMAGTRTAIVHTLALCAGHTDELGRPPLVWRSHAGYTALRYAAWKGHGTAVVLLLEAGADPLAEDMKAGNSILALAKDLSFRSTINQASSVNLVEVRRRSVSPRGLRLFPLSILLLRPFFCLLSLFVVDRSFF